MKSLTLENITKICNGIYHGPQEKLQEEVTAITTDSRKVEKGGLFVPVVGERVDAHRFIPQVMEAGALATLSERTLEGADHPYIQVGSSLQAVKDIAEFYLEQLDIPVVGITGSVGKTSTKEVIASVLKEKYRTLKTQGNFNNELGLPLTVFRLRALGSPAAIWLVPHPLRMMVAARIPIKDFFMFISLSLLCWTDCFIKGLFPINHLFGHASVNGDVFAIDEVVLVLT